MQARLVVRFATSEFDHEHFLHEFWMVIWHRRASWLIGQKIPLLKASFTYPRFSHPSALSNIIPSVHEFNQDSNQLIFANHYLRAPLVRTGAEVAEFLRHSPADLMTTQGEDFSVNNRIARSIFAHYNTKTKFPSTAVIPLTP